MVETSRDPRYPEALLSVQDACEMLGISRPTLFRLIGRGELSVVKLARRTLFRPADLDALVLQSLRRRGSEDESE
jgi:excisionase family DNA binding protein